MRGKMILDASRRKRLPALLLCLLLGVLGAHRFYTGKHGTAVLQLLTLGGAGLWMLMDLVLIAAGRFRDKEGLPLAEWA